MRVKVLPFNAREWTALASLCTATAPAFADLALGAADKAWLPGELGEISVQEHNILEEAYREWLFSRTIPTDDLVAELPSFCM